MFSSNENKKRYISSPIINSNGSCFEEDNKYNFFLSFITILLVEHLDKYNHLFRSHR